MLLLLPFLPVLFGAVCASSSSAKDASAAAERLDEYLDHLAAWRVGPFPFENDRTGFYVDAFLHHLGEGSPEATELLSNEAFKQHYLYRVMSAAIATNHHSEGILEKSDPTLHDNLKHAIGSDVSTNRMEAFRMACSNSDLPELQQSFIKLGFSGGSSVEVNGLLDYDLLFKFTFDDDGSTVLHEAVKHNNLPLLRSCLGFNHFSVHDRNLPSACPNAIAKCDFGAVQMEMTPLMLAVSLGRVHAAELLLKHPATKPWQSPIIGLNSRMVAYNHRSLVIRKQMIDLFQRFHFPIEQKQCKNPIEAELWNLLGEPRREFVIELVNTRNKLALKSLVWEEKLNLGEISAATRTEIFRTVVAMKLLQHQQEMIDFLHGHGFKFDWEIGNAYYKGRLQFNYYPSVMDQVLTQTVPPQLLNHMIERRVFNGASINDLITWALGRHDSTLLKLIFKNYPNATKEYKDPISSEPLIHIVVRELYKVTRDLDLIRQLVNLGVDVNVKFDGMKDRTAWVYKRFDFAEKAGWWRNYPAFTAYRWMKFTSEPTSKSIAHYLKGRGEFDDEMVSFLANHLSAENKSDLDKFKERVDTELQAPDISVAYSYSCELTNAYIKGFHFDRDPVYVHRWMKSLDTNIACGAAAASLFHTTISPLPLMLTFGSLEDVVQAGMNVNQIALLDETIEGVDENGQKCSKCNQYWTPLMVVMFQNEWCGRSKCIELLLNAKADMFYTAPSGYNCASALLNYIHSTQSKKLQK